MVFVMSMSSDACSRGAGGPIAEPEVHLIPAGFIGHVILRHQRDEAAPLGREGAARLYVIPPGGVLETRSAPNWGVREPEKMRFFYLDPASGRRTPLHVLGPGGHAMDDGVHVLGGYQVRSEFHYFVDRPSNASKYPNPAILPGGRG